MRLERPQKRAVNRGRWRERPVSVTAGVARVIAAAYGGMHVGED